MLCDLLALLEALGVYPEDLEQVLVAPIPKPTGGERPIGLYLALFRVWSAARVQALRDWERDSAQCPAFNTAGAARPPPMSSGGRRCALRLLAPRCSPS